MTDRDRLIELNRKAKNYALEKADERSGLVCIDDEVDYLLANGVIVPPCKVGDFVYSSVRYSGYYMRKKDAPYSYKVCFIGINDYEGHGGGFVNVVHENGSMLQFEFSQFGKTVFLTKEEAEEKLRELKGNA